MKKPLILAVSLSLISLFLVFSILQNYLVYSHLKKMDLDQASKNSKTAIILPEVINVLSFNKIPTLRLWVFALHQMPIINESKKDLETYINQVVNGEEANEEIPKKIIDNLEKINDELNKIDIKQLSSFNSAIKDAVIIAKELIAKDQNYIVILQNSDEIRATGGFIGSYLELKLKNGAIEPIQIQDIYAPDGQYQGFKEAPKGLAEYLSSGKGMRLPDANWWPNFPDSAKEILYFFKEADQQDRQGIIAVNLNTVEELLDITGEIYLPDYKKNINKNNFAKIAREDRNEFFPGSQEKANFLNHFFNMFKLELAKSFQKDPVKFFALSKKLLMNKELQFYSSNETIQKILEQRQLAGTMTNSHETPYYFLVESNVGINKANRLVDRQVQIKLDDQQNQIIINFQNNNPFPYINYQRLYTNEENQLLSVKINDQNIEKIDQRKMQTKDGKTWTEIGFLSSTLANGHSKIEINLQSPSILLAKKQIFIQKQAGLPTVNYAINYYQQNQTLELTSDQLLNFD